MVVLELSAALVGSTNSRESREEPGVSFCCSLAAQGSRVAVTGGLGSGDRRDPWQEQLKAALRHRRVQNGRKGAEHLPKP